MSSSLLMSSPRSSENRNPLPPSPLCQLFGRLEKKRSLRHQTPRAFSDPLLPQYKHPAAPHPPLQGFPPRLHPNVQPSPAYGASPVSHHMLPRPPRYVKFGAKGKLRTGGHHAWVSLDTRGRDPIAAHPRITTGISSAGHGHHRNHDLNRHRYHKIFSKTFNESNAIFLVYYFFSSSLSSSTYHTHFSARNFPPHFPPIFSPFSQAADFSRFFQRLEFFPAPRIFRFLSHHIFPPRRFFLISFLVSLFLIFPLARFFLSFRFLTAPLVFVLVSRFALSPRRQLFARLPVSLSPRVTSAGARTSPLFSPAFPEILPAAKPAKTGIFPRRFPAAFRPFFRFPRAPPSLKPQRARYRIPAKSALYPALSVHTRQPNESAYAVAIR